MRALSRRPLYRCLLFAGHTAAAMRLDEGIEIIAPVVVGDFIPGMDVPDRGNDDLVALDVALGIRPAGMVHIARDVAFVRPIERPAVVDLEQVLCPQRVGIIVGDHATGIVGDEFAAPDGFQRVQSKASPGTANAKTAWRRSTLQQGESGHGWMRISWAARC